ncbi:glycosyltransferase family 32 protein [Komagataeibacter rhaeticus]|uniref:glycosyltransferase family 32 protein n=2 Tax=Komagataeibacter rhaeticus TaxID=215221 RepID=UPI002181E8AB|nr:glycosyltransferase [Komagataeibacter rhaeticus]
MDIMIVSHFFTFLCIDNGRIYQANICDFKENQARIASVTDIVHCGYAITPLAGQTGIAFTKGTLFMSALPDGSVTHVPHLLGWERFRVFDRYRPFQVPSLRASGEIPRIIHQTDSCSFVREQFKKNSNAIRAVNTDCDYIFYSEKDRHDFIYNHFGWEILNFYMKIHPAYGAARADLFRYLCIYKCGGIYLDMKSGTEKPFSNIIRDRDEILLSCWDSKKSDRFHGWGRGAEISHAKNGEFQQWFIISRPGNRLLEKVINQVLANIALYEESIHGVGRQAVFQTTGPYAFTRAILTNLNNTHYRIIDSEMEGIIYNNITNYEKTSRYDMNRFSLTI